MTFYFNIKNEDENLKYSLTQDIRLHVPVTEYISNTAQLLSMNKSCLLCFNYIVLMMDVCLYAQFKPLLYSKCLF